MRLPTAPAGRPLEAIRVLVVDDEEDIGQIVVAILSAHGAQADWVASAAQARERLRFSRFDVLLSDINMPYESGCDLVRKLRMEQGDGHLPVLAAMTARVSTQDRLEMEEVGFVRVIAKPFNIAELVSAVCELARARRPSSLTRSNVAG